MNHSCREILDTFYSDSLSVLLQLRFFYAGSGSLDKPGQCSVNTEVYQVTSEMQEHSAGVRGPRLRGQKPQG